MTDQTTSLNSDQPDGIDPDETSLRNQISDAIGQLLDQHRAAAAAPLGPSDLADAAMAIVGPDLARRGGAHRRDLIRNTNLTGSLCEEIERLHAQLESAHRQVDRSIQRLQQLDVAGPQVVCICGSMRFQAEMLDASVDESLAGNVVVLPLVNMKRPDARWATDEQADQIKTDLDRLHFAKIDMADEVLVVNPGGYIGESTRREITHAEQHGKPVRYLAPSDTTEEA